MNIISSIKQAAGKVTRRSGPRVLTVKKAWHLTPHMIRVTFAGPERLYNVFRAGTRIGCGANMHGDFVKIARCCKQCQFQHGAVTRRNAVIRL